jgi:hypothetical protein
MESPVNTEHLLMDAVNILLQTIDELPIEDEEDYDNIIEARIARDNIIEAKRAVLSEGWDFNTDKNWTLPLDIRHMIPVPQNVLDITANRSDVIMRDWRLYSKKDQSHIFEEEVPCDITWDLDFNSLSHPLRHYITIRAARLFQTRMIGDEKQTKYNEVDEEDARLAARRSESRTGQYNMLTSGLYGVNNRVRTN